jgi:hypothetical protein
LRMFATILKCFLCCTVAVRYFISYLSAFIIGGGTGKYPPANLPW